MNKTIIFVGILSAGISSCVYGMNQIVFFKEGEDSSLEFNFEKSKNYAEEYTIETSDKDNIEFLKKNLSSLSAYFKQNNYSCSTIKGSEFLQSLCIKKLLNTACRNPYYMSYLFYAGLPIKKTPGVYQELTGLPRILKNVKKKGFILGGKEYTKEKEEEVCAAVGDYLTAIIMPPRIHEKIAYNFAHERNRMKHFLCCLYVKKNENNKKSCWIYTVPKPVLKKIFIDYVKSGLALNDENLLFEQLLGDLKTDKKILEKEAIQGKIALSAIEFLDTCNGDFTELAYDFMKKRSAFLQTLN